MEANQNLVVHLITTDFQVHILSTHSLQGNSNGIHCDPWGRKKNIFPTFSFCRLQPLNVVSPVSHVQFVMQLKIKAL